MIILSLDKGKFQLLGILTIYIDFIIWRFIEKS